MLINVPMEEATAKSAELPDIKGGFKKQADGTLMVSINKGKGDAKRKKALTALEKAGFKKTHHLALEPTHGNISVYKDEAGTIATFVRHGDDAEEEGYENLWEMRVWPKGHKLPAEIKKAMTAKHKEKPNNRSIVW